MKDKSCFLFIVGLLLPFTNIVVGVLRNWHSYNITHESLSFINVTTLILVALAEELFFRGLLLRELVFRYKWRAVRASLIVSFAFGVLHLVNVNSYATLEYAIVQSVCAFSVSFNLSAIFVRTPKLWICVLIHALINITSIGLDIGNQTAKLFVSNGEAIVFLLVSFIYLACGIKMLNHKMAEGN